MTEPVTDDPPMEAAEYVLSLLSADEAKAFEARLTQSPDLRDEVAYWREELAGITETIAPVTPPPEIFPEIMKRLFSEPNRRRFSLGLPRLVEIALGAVAAAFFAFGVIFLTQANLTGPNTVFETEIAAADRSLVVQAFFNSDTGVLRCEREDGAAREGRVHQLWLIAGDNPPVSLGVFPGDGVVEWVVQDSLRAQMVGGTLAISDEPPGGSPTGAPTGAVLATGTITGA